MLLLVMGSNFLIMFVGWEGVGLCSYLLIGFWYKNDAYNKAASKAFIMNRIGDLGFLLGIVLIALTFGSLEYTSVFDQAKGYPGSDATITAITLLLFVGATGKSAQIPLYTWLPDAMAGPTPVSALIHAATMVTAGIYMVARSNILFTLSPITMQVVATTGIATALLAATIGLAQNDIKIVLAYSTVSQLGLMFTALGFGAFGSAVFHVMTHAFFKACLFLGAGSVIHAMHHQQDIRKMGGLRKYMPITYLTFFISTLAIAGIFPFSGFFSKDEMLAQIFSHNRLFWLLGIIVSIFTAFYMFRLFYLTFHGSFRGTEKEKSHLHESPPAITIPLMLIALGLILLQWDLFRSPSGDLEFSKDKVKGVLFGLLALGLWTFYAIKNAALLKRMPKGIGADWSSLKGLFSLASIFILVGAHDIYQGTNSWSPLIERSVHDILIFCFWTALLGIGSSWIATWLWNLASRELPTSLTGQLIVSETLFGLTYGFIYLRRSPTAFELTAMILMLVGIMLSLRKKRL
jgi:NADH:ubiquinone oxidoreductase subunit 5 (subunit L)/multisubunit Na+/H+ antiporter MnhA subunit